MHEHRVGLVRRAAARTATVAIASERAGVVAALDHDRVGQHRRDRPHLYDRGRRPRRRRGRARPSRAARGPGGRRTRRAPARRRGPARSRSTSLVLGAVQQRAGPAHADAAHARRPLHRAHALELRREPTARARARAGRRGCRSQISSAIRSTPSGAELRSAAITSNVRSSGTCATNSVGIEVGLGAQPGERVPDVGRERIDLERREHFGAAPRRRRRRDTSTWARAMRAAVTEHGNQGSVGSSTRSSTARAPFDLAELQVRGRVEEVAEVGTGRVLAHDLGPRRHLPRPVATPSRMPATNAAADARTAGSVAPSARELEPVERLLVAELGRGAAGRGRTLRCPRRVDGIVTPRLERCRSSIGTACRV